MIERRRGTTRVAALLLLAAGAVRAEDGSAGRAPVVEGAPEFERAALPAAGRQATLLSVSTFGRYSIAVASASGTALQLVDRMSGAGEIAGSAGERDGRIDLFLDRGDVRVVTYGARLATGEARLAARPFADRSPAEPERLVEGKLVAGELGDLEERSWWIELPKRRRVAIEAAGRSLADLRLWQDGSWLVDAEPRIDTVEPAPGQPLGRARLTADLPPGLYRLTVYGGEERAWARGSASHPLWLRSGISRDATSLRERRVVSPFGADRVLVSGDAEYTRVERTTPGELEFEMADYDADRPFFVSGWSGRIQKEMTTPVETVAPGSSEDERVIEVRGEPGTPYVIQHGILGQELRLAKAGRYWIAAVAAGAPGDAIDSTAIAVELGDGRERAARVVAADVPNLSPASGSGWSGRFNLLSATTLQFRVDAAGEYELRSTRGAVTARIEPFFVSPPSGYATPPARTVGPEPSVWSLDPGFYVLALEPVIRGIAELQLVPKGAPPLAPTPRGAANLGIVEVGARREILVRTNDRPESPTGLLARGLPIDLVAALPVALAPGEMVEVPFRSPGAAVLTALDEGGRALDLAVDGGAFAPRAEVGAGEHGVRVRLAPDVGAPVSASLALVAAERAADAPLPALGPESREKLAALPEFPGLVPEAAPRPLDVERGGGATFAVRADEAALYRIETTGLLATEAVLRTRIQPNLARAAENGSGRNALLASYLRTGDYQLTVRPRGASAGHLGVRVERSAVEDAGALPVEPVPLPEASTTPPSEPARRTVPTDRALAWTFELEHASVVRASARGLVDDFTIRLEDADGWPVSVPYAAGEQVVALFPGSYRLLVLPQPVEARASVAVAELRPADPAGESSDDAKGAGVDLPLDREIERTWHEGTPDRIRFALPAATRVALALPVEMEGELRPLGDASAPPTARLKAGKPFRGELARGAWELRVRAARRDEGRRYRVSVRPDDLVEGLRRDVTAPADLFVAVGSEGDYEIASFGPRDLRARLFDLDGRELAAGDDRPGDWNFLLSRRLQPGRYRLRVDADASRRSSAVRSTVELRRPRERLLPELAAGEALTLSLDDATAIVPLRGTTGQSVVAVGARSAESLGLALEERQGSTWRKVAEATGRDAVVALPLAADEQSLRLRVQSLDRRPAEVRLTTFAGALARRTEAELARGFELPRLGGVEPPIAAAVVALEAPGCFRRADDTALLQSIAGGTPFAPAAPTLAAVGLAIPLAAVPGAEAPRVQATRARVGDGEPLALALPPGTPLLCDVADGGPATVVLAATNGEPVVGFVSDSGDWGRSTALGAPSGLTAWAAAPAGRGRAVELWNAGERAVEARLDGALAKEVAPPAGSEGTTWVVPAGVAMPLALGRGAKSVRVTLAEGASALLLADGEPAAYVHGTGGAAGASGGAIESFATDADRVLLFGPRKSNAVNPAGTAEEAVAGVAVRPLAEGETAGTLAVGAAFERRFVTSGALRLTLPPTPGATAVEIRGASDVAFLGGDGRVGRGESIAIPPAGGELRFGHGAGFVVARRDAAENLAIGRTVAAGVRAERVAAPAAVTLVGDSRAFEVALARPALVSFRSAGALSASVEAGGRVLASGAFPDGARLDAVAPAGTVRIGVAGLAEAPLSGLALFAVSPIATLREGLGDELLLAPGESRAWTFAVADAGLVGVGVRSDRAGVEARLESADGTRLGGGAAIWRELAKGDYRLVVSAPADGEPARVRPALLGTESPSDGPPREEVERFLALAGATPPPPSNGVRGVENTAREPGVRSSAPASEEDEWVEDETSDDSEEEEEP